MPLDPQAEAFLTQMKESGAPAWEAMTPSEARSAATGFKELGGEPEYVASVENCFIPGPTADLPARIYRPRRQHPYTQPGLIYFHGGGWAVANIDIADTLTRSITNRTGCTVVAVNYQKAPEHKFPIPVDDCYAATQWVFDNAEALGLDTRRIGVIGDSAGANLASAVTLRSRDQDGPRIAYQALINPVLDYSCDTQSYSTYAAGYGIERTSMLHFWYQYISDTCDGTNPYLSPLTADDFTGLPPALIVASEFDPSCDDARNYALKLEAADVPVQFRLYEGMIHGFIWMSGIFDQSRTLLDEIGMEVRSALNHRP
jgi:acetyl esterase